MVYIYNNYLNVVLFEIFQISTSATKKLWEKSGVGDMKMSTSGPLAPWRDSTWSTHGDILAPSHRPYPHQESNQNTGILR